MYSFDPTTGDMVPFDVVWYAAPAGAIPLGVHHQYGSYNYQKGTAYPDQVGEIIGAGRPWSNGATPPGVTGVGHCGTQWTGELQRLTTPIPDNVFDQPACCPIPALCQPQIAATPAVDNGDGSGLVAMTNIGSNTWRRRFSTGGVLSIFARKQAPACLGHTLRWNVRIGTTAGGYAGARDTGLFAYDAGTQIGSWYVPMSSAFLPGQVLLLFG